MSESRLKGSSQSDRCANCGMRIPEGSVQVWNGKFFCNLDCVAIFGELDFSERARRLAAAASN